MPKIAMAINKFNYGEISPLMAGRFDLSKYQSGCRVMENFIPLLQGPVQRRGGTRFIARAANGDKPVALIEFSFSETTSYVIEAGDKYLRFYSNGRPVLNSGGAPYQVASPWGQADLFLENGICALKYVQSGDVMYVVCPTVAPQKIMRYGALDWRLSALGGWGSRPKPNAVALFRERLCLAAGQTVYMSQSGAFDNFQLTQAVKDADGKVIVPIAADDPLEISVYSEKMDVIQWLCPSGDDLLAGTQGGEFLIGQTTTVDPLGPENVKVSPGTSSTSSAVQALRVGSVIMFSRRSGLKIDQFFFDYTGDSYESADVTRASEHITRGGVVALAWASEPIETLLAVRADGQLLGFVYSKQEEMAAWYRLVLGGGGRVSALAVIPAALGGRDQIYVSVRREINGAAVYYIETLEAGHEPGADVSESFFVDSGVTVRVEAPVWEVGGLEHLEGCEVAILADGGVLPNRVVRGGTVDLQDGAEAIVQVGLPYDSVLSTVNLELAMPDGTSQGRKKRFVSARLRLLESMGGAAGPSLDCLDRLEFRTPDDRMDAGVPLFSGDVRVSWPGGYELDGSLTIKQEYPLPFTLLAIFPNVLMEGLD